MSELVEALFCAWLFYSAVMLTVLASEASMIRIEIRKAMKRVGGQS